MSKIDKLINLAILHIISTIDVATVTKLETIKRDCLQGVRLGMRRDEERGLLSS